MKIKVVNLANTDYLTDMDYIPNVGDLICENYRGLNTMFRIDNVVHLLKKNTVIVFVRIVDENYLLNVIEKENPYWN